MWKEINKLYAWGGFHTDGVKKLLDSGYFAIYEQGNQLKLLSANDFSQPSLDLGKGNIYKIVSNIYLFISYGDQLKKLNLDDLTIETICTTDEKNILIFDEKYCIASTLTRKPEWSFSYEIKSLASCSTYYKWNFNSTLHLIVDGDLLLSDESTKNKYLTRINPNTDTKLWRYDFNDDYWGSDRYMQFADDILVITLTYENQGEYQNDTHCHLIGLDINTGKIKWKLDKGLIFPWYQFDEIDKKLFAVDGFENVIYQVIDPLTGTIEVEKNLSNTYDNIEVNCRNVFFADDGYLYFSSNTRTPYENSDLDYDYLQPQVGAINTKTHELEYLQDIEVDMKKIDRPSNALGMPVVYKNRMYVMDSGNNLHILEKE